MINLVRLVFILGLCSGMTELFAKEKSSISLADLKWQQRLVIAKVDDHSQFISTLKTWPQQQLDDRKLKVFLLSKNQTFEVNSDAVLTPVTLIPSEYEKIMIADDTVILIGLDGGVKSRFSISEFNPKTINQIIDSMPMRMAESYF